MRQLYPFASQSSMTMSGSGSQCETDLTVFVETDSISLFKGPRRPMRGPIPHRIVTSLIAAVLLFPAVAGLAQTEKEMRRAFVDLRDDQKKNNCGDAIAWLYPRREELKDALVDELYRTDPQGVGAIMFILYNTKSFTPDERFIRLVMQYLSPGSSRRMPKGWFDLPLDPPDPTGKRREITGPWEYIDAHFDVFEPLLTAQISTTKDSWFLWATAWLFKKRGIFETKVELFTPEVLGVAAANLAGDEVPWNASGAIRLFLILGERTEPTLRAALRSSDSQARYFSKATLDALKGEHRAFGYLGSKVNLSETVFGPRVLEPEWMSELVLEYMDRDAYP
jgi:hypothetical protein